MWFLNFAEGGGEEGVESDGDEGGGNMHHLILSPKFHEWFINFAEGGGEEGVEGGGEVVIWNGLF